MSESSAQTLASILNSVGVELVIFTVTVGLGILVKASTKNRATISRKVAKTVDTITNSAEEDEDSYSPRAAHQRRPAQQKQQQARQPAELVGQIMYIMREHSSQASASQALQLYSELRMSVGLGSHDNQRLRADSFVEATKRAKHNGGSLYLTLVQCAVRSKQSHLVERIIEDMKALGVARSLFFYESAMKQLAGQKQYRLALQCYDHLRADGMEPSVVTYSCLIGFAAEVGENQRAIQFFNLLSANATPSIRAYMTVLRVYSQQQDWTAAAATLRDMKQRDVKVDSLSLNVVLATGIVADKLDEVEALLAEADAAEPPISDVVSYNTLIKGYAQRGDSQAAVRVKDRMLRRGLKPTTITFNTLMDGAVRVGRLENAWDILKEMRSCGLKADRFTCSILVKGATKHPTIEHIPACLQLLLDASDRCDAALKSTLYHTIFQTACGDEMLLMQVVRQMRKQQVQLNENASKKLRDRIQSASSE